MIRFHFDITICTKEQDRLSCQRLSTPVSEASSHPPKRLLIYGYGYRNAHPTKAFASKTQSIRPSILDSAIVICNSQLSEMMDFTVPSPSSLKFCCFFHHLSIGMNRLLIYPLEADKHQSACTETAPLVADSIRLSPEPPARLARFTKFLVLVLRVSEYLADLQILRQKYLGSLGTTQSYLLPGLLYLHLSLMVLARLLVSKISPLIRHEIKEEVLEKGSSTAPMSVEHWVCFRS